MSDHGWIEILRWDEFQHRDMARSSVPPWIKAYTRLLSDDEYLALSHHLRGVLLGLWLEYARARRQLSGSTVGLSRRLGQRVTTRDLERLTHAGYIRILASKPASNVASKPASLEVEVEVEENPSYLPTSTYNQEQEGRNQNQERKRPPTEAEIVNARELGYELNGHPQPEHDDDNIPLDLPTTIGHPIP